MIASKTNAHSDSVQSQPASLSRLSAELNRGGLDPVSCVGDKLNTLKSYLDSLRMLSQFKRDMAKTSETTDFQADVQRNSSMCRDTDIDQLLGSLNNLADEIREATSTQAVDNDCAETFVLTDLNRCVDLVADLVWDELKCECQVEQRFANIPLVMAQPRALHKIILTLLTHAAESVDRFGEILVATHRDAQDVVLRIAITGDAISASEIATVQEWVANQGGAIFIRNKDNTGTEIELRLPAAEQSLARS